MGTDSLSIVTGTSCTLSGHELRAAESSSLSIDATLPGRSISTQDLQELRLQCGLGNRADDGVQLLSALEEDQRRNAPDAALHRGLHDSSVGISASHDRGFSGGQHWGFHVVLYLSKALLHAPN